MRLVHLQPHPPRHKFRGGHSIDAVAQMRRQHDRQSIADEVGVEAVGVRLVRGDILKRPAVVWVAEEDDACDVRRGGGGELLRS